MTLHESTAINQKLKRNQPTQLQSDEGQLVFQVSAEGCVDSRKHTPYNLTLEGIFRELASAQGLPGVRGGPSNGLQ